MPSKVVFGDKELIAKIRRLKDEVRGRMGEVTLTGAEMLVGFIKVSMQEAHHGREYRRSGKIHVASAPGETPAIDYGNLINSLDVNLQGDDSVVSTNSEAAAPLEFGTSNMAARPFMRPAVDEHEDEIQAAMAATAKRIINEAAKK